MQVLRTTQLAELGYTRADIARMARSGQLISVRRGWYATPHAPDNLVAAVRDGGSLSCLSRLQQMGIWVPPPGRIHIRRARTPSPCWPGTRIAVDSADDDLLTAFACAANCVDHDFLIAIADSILHQRLCELPDLRDALNLHKHRDALRHCDPAAESGLESLPRVRLRRAGHRVASQVDVPEVGRVDLKIGEWLLLEADGRSYHSAGAQFRNDRRRDRVAQIAGYLVFRLTYDDVMFAWDEVYAQIAAIVAERRHVRRRK